MDSGRAAGRSDLKDPVLSIVVPVYNEGENISRTLDSLREHVTADPLEVVVVYDFDQDSTQESIAKAMQNNLKDVGINAALRPHPFADYLTFALTGQQELFRLGWTTPVAAPTADGFLTPLFLTGSHENPMGAR